MERIIIIEMNQRKFVEKILERFNMSDCKSKAVPCELGTNKASAVNESEFENVTLHAKRGLIQISRYGYFTVLAVKL